MRHHLAVLYRTSLDEILAGRKTVECRLGHSATAPHNAVQAGDLIWLKQVSGPVRALAVAKSVRRFEPLTTHLLGLIRRQWGPLIRESAGFWRVHRSATHATLIWFGDVTPVEPFLIDKRDSRRWLTLPGPLVPGQSV